MKVQGQKRCFKCRNRQTIRAKYGFRRVCVSCVVRYIRTSCCTVRNLDYYIRSLLVGLVPVLARGSSDKASKQQDGVLRMKMTPDDGQTHL
jgi:hypothetical protein